MPSDPALLDDDGVARPHPREQLDRAAAADLSACNWTVDLHVPAIGTRREAAADRNRGFDRHVGDIGVLAWERYLAEDEKRPISVDFDRDMGFAEIAATQAVGDGGRELGGGGGAGGHGAGP